LEGVSASGYIEVGEIQPLIAECEEFVKYISDGDAEDIIQDFRSDLLCYETVFDCAKVRQSRIDNYCSKSSMNRFLGFCRGVACDGVIRLSEAAKIVDLCEKNPKFLDVIGVKQICFICREAISDGEIDEEESKDICLAISEIVGDSYGDTGLASSFKVAAFSETYLQDLEAELIDRVVVFTGNFSTSPRSILEQFVEERGAIVAKHVSSNTHLLIVGGEASRDWIELNRGTKIRKALELRQKMRTPFFISEVQLMKLMD
jgi:hypothetical protein